MTILAVDIGTTSMKLGVFQAGGPDPAQLEQAASWSQDYQINTYNNGLFADIEPEKWRNALARGCRELATWMPKVEAVALSGTTPGLTAMDHQGEALLPAILMLDQRSRRQAAEIITRIGLERLLADTANMPVAGGCSLASILWIRENAPELYKKAACFGHTNTYIARWLTGELAIDPSSASLTALYNTTANDLTWNAGIASELSIELDRLPRLIPCSESSGRVREPIARDLQLSRRPPVIIGGNDAVLAAYSAGCREPGQVINVNGTCEITLVCLGKCHPSRNYNIRAHVLPHRWLTLYVMNAGGIALEWFRSVFCRELSEDQFFDDFLPRAIDQGLARESPVRYVPFLMGSRYTQEALRAEFIGMNQKTTREELAAALVRGLAEYQREHLKEISLEMLLAPVIAVTGGAVNPAMIRAKQRWMRACEYVHVEQSSLRGAAMLALEHLAGQARS